MSLPCALGEGSNRNARDYLALLSGIIMKQQGVGSVTDKLGQSFLPGDIDTTTKTIIPLLHGLTSPDNDARNRAERSFNALKESHPEDVIYGLLEVCLLAYLSSFVPLLCADVRSQKLPPCLTGSF